MQIFPTSISRKIISKNSNINRRAARRVWAALAAFALCCFVPFGHAEDVSSDSSLGDDLQQFGALPYRDGWYFRLTGRALFPAGNPQPTADAAEKMARLASILRRHPEITLRLEGHIDRAEALSTRSEVARARAINVGRLLAGRGLSPKKIKIIGFGDSRPIADADVPATSSQNRRVDILIIKSDKGAVAARGRAAFGRDLAASKTGLSGWWGRARRGEMLNLDGYFKHESAYQTPRPSGFTKMRTTGFLSVSGRLSEVLSYKASGRAFYDAVFGLTHRYPPPVAEDLRSQVELRDTYADFSIGDWDLRVGKQQTVWGEAIGVFIADAVNAKDYREFILPSFDFMRRPHWGANLEYTHNDFHTEVTGIPFPLFHLLARPGYEFAATQNVPANVAVRVEEVRDPARTPNNGEIGGRVSYLYDGWDVAAFHLYAWDKFPVYYRRIGPGAQVVYSPGRSRLPVTGSTFSKEFLGVVWRGEALYSAGKLLSTEDLRDRDGVVRRDTLDYLLGFNYNFAKKIDMNLQFIQRRVFNYGPTQLANERPEQSSVSLWIKTGYFDNRLEPEILVMSDVKRADMMIIPKVAYTFAGSWQAIVGYDFFEGKPSGPFGQYDRHDRAFVELKFTF